MVLKYNDNLKTLKQYVKPFKIILSYILLFYFPCYLLNINIKYRGNVDLINMTMDLD